MLQLIINSVLLGAGLAMDAFSISIANGIVEPGMRKRRMLLIAGVYAVFQFMMPMLGWLLVTTLEEIFTKFSILIPWIALVLLLFIGGKMIFEGITKKTHGDKQEEEKVSEHGKLTAAVLLVQGLATSIDALSVGFTISEYKVSEALLSSAIIGAVTFAICVAGLVFGKKIGERFSDKATVIGGIILIFIGFEILIKSFI